MENAKYNYYENWYDWSMPGPSEKQIEDAKAKLHYNLITDLLTKKYQFFQTYLKEPTHCFLGKKQKGMFGELRILAFKAGSKEDNIKKAFDELYGLKVVELVDEDKLYVGLVV